MTDSLRHLEFNSEEERLLAALSLALLGLDLIAHSKSSHRSQRDAAAVGFARKIPEIAARLAVRRDRWG